MSAVLSAVEGIVSNLSRLMLLATLAMLAVVPAKADTVKFYSGGAGYTGPFNGAGTVYDATKGIATDCPSGSPGCTGGGAPDILSTPQVFQGGIVTASANGSNNVWNDLSPPFAGLGVGLLSQGDAADQISGSDILHIHFNSAVQLLGVGTLFASDHDPFGTFTSGSVTAANTFLLNGVVTTFGAANLAMLSLFGQDFDFQQNGPNQPGFYVSALSFVASPVPLPGAIWLFASGIAGIGLLARRSRKNQSAIAA
jgi:hypothetical protein